MGLTGKTALIWYPHSGCLETVVGKTFKVGPNNVALPIKVKMHGLTDKTFSKLVAEFIEYGKKHKRSWKRDHFSIKKLNAHFSEKRTRGITPAMIEDYIAARSKDVSSATINRELICMKTVYRIVIRKSVGTWALRISTSTTSVTCS